MSKRQARLWALALGLAMLAALAVRLTALGRKSLWLDEAASLMRASQPVAAIFGSTGDPHPPLYYALLHFWLLLGRSEFVLRLPSALAGALAVPLFYILVRQWSSKTTALIAAWLLALAPMHLWYSQEVRMYALLCTLGLASALCYTLALRHDRPLAWLGWLVATVLGLYVHYGMLGLVWLQLVLFVPLWRRESRSWRTLGWGLVLLVVAVLLYRPQGLTMIRQIVLGRGGGWYFLTLQGLLNSAGLSISLETVQRLIAFGVVAAFGAGSVVVGFLPWAARQSPKRASMIVALALYAGLLLFYAIPRGLGLKRQILIVFPYVLWGIAAVLATHRHWLRLLLGVVLLTLPVSGYTVLFQEQEAWRDVAAYLELQLQAEDVLVMTTTDPLLPLRYYVEDTLPVQVVRPAEVAQVLPDVLERYSRIWFISRQESYTDPLGHVPQWLDVHWRRLKTLSFPRVEVILYAAPE